MCTRPLSAAAADRSRDDYGHRTGEMLDEIMRARKHLSPGSRRVPSIRVAGRRGPPRGSRDPPAKALWIYGTHAVLAALANPKRRLRRLLATPRAAEALAPRIRELARRRSAAPEPERRTREEIARELDPGAVHQGIALLAEPLQGPSLAEALLHAESAPRAVHVVLDRASDPQNVGAVLRSAAAFGAGAVVLSRRHAPSESGALAKAASGALERVPLVRVANLAGALEAHKRAGFWCVGLDTKASATISRDERQAKLALVFGSEGGGLRRLTREHCDELVRVPIAAGSQSLNLAAAAAIALYEAARGRS